jgi:hypothetical protein
MEVRPWRPSRVTAVRDISVTRYGQSRHAFENFFCSPKAFRRIATGYGN